jgi:hypothetical protein
MKQKGTLSRLGFPLHFVIFLVLKVDLILCGSLWPVPLVPYESSSYSNLVKQYLSPALQGLGSNMYTIHVECAYNSSIISERLAVWTCIFDILKQLCARLWPVPIV